MCIIKFYTQTVIKFMICQIIWNYNLPWGGTLLFWKGLYSYYPISITILLNLFRSIQSVPAGQLVLF